MEEHLPAHFMFAMHLLAHVRAALLGGSASTASTTIAPWQKIAWSSGYISELVWRDWLQY